MNRKNFLAAAIVIFTVLLSSFSFYGYQILKSPNILVDKEDRYVEIPEGADFKIVQNMMYDDGIAQDLLSFSFLSKLMKYDKAVKPGRYLLRKNMTNVQAIRLLRSGNQVPVNITFNNIRLKEEIGERITKNIALGADSFQKALDLFAENNPYGFNENTIISMFIPNTYQVYYNTSADKLIERMHNEYEKFWNSERQKKASDLGLTRTEVATLASLVQAEQMAHPDERKRIAGLYINRLNRGIKLDSDPTLVFAFGDFSIKRVLNVHKEINSPYNTYKLGGLPPGPINMPEASSLDAVLDFEQHDYLYMCAKEDFSGYHNFAKSLAEHSINAKKYQRQLTIEMRKGAAKQNAQ